MSFTNCMYAEDPLWERACSRKRSPIDTESGSVRRNQQLPQSRSMLNNLPGQLQPLIVQVAIILPSRRQLIQVQFNRKLSLLPPGLEQQRAQRIHQRAAAGKQQA